MKVHDVRQFINHDSEFFSIVKQLPTIDVGGPWIAGGSVWKSIEQIPLETDVDVFFSSPQQCEKWYRRLLSIPYGHRIVSDPKSNNYNTSLKYHVNNSRGFNKTITLQLISFRFFESMETLLDGFDFTACQFGFDGQHLYSGDTSFDDLRNREIIFHSIQDEIATCHHVEKYLKNGFKIPERESTRYAEITTNAGKSYKARVEPPSSMNGVPSYYYSQPAGQNTVEDSSDDYPRPASPGAINLTQITQIPTPTPVAVPVEIPTISGAFWRTEPSIDSNNYASVVVSSDDVTIRGMTGEPLTLDEAGPNPYISNPIES